MGEATAAQNLATGIKGGPSVFTIGHSIHELNTFLALLARHEVALLMDVRIIPKSQRLPHFNLESLAPELSRRGISITSTWKSWEEDGRRLLIR